MAVSDLKGRSHALSAVRVWTPETKVLEKDLVADTTKSDGWASIIRDDLLQRVPEKMPVMLDYKLLAESGSLHNTPPCYAIYMVGLVMKWLKGLGGLAEMYKINQQKAGLVYSAIDSSGGFYRGHAVPAARSIMNVPFRLPSEELEDSFVKESTKAELIGLKGHRSVGGLRASLYNALPLESAQALVSFMSDFQRRHG